MNLFRTVAMSAAVLCTMEPVHAGGRARGPYANLAPGIVVAESRVGNGTVTGAVRNARFGREVRLPGGSWEPCKRSCSETLRVNTVDFWEAREPNAIAPECGVFGCLTLRYPR